MFHLVVVSCIVFSAAAGIILLVVRRVSKAKTQEQQVLGLKWAVLLREFLENVQKHRGMSTGFIKGEASLEREIESLQKKITRDIHNIEVCGDWVKESDRWVGIIEHWRRLSIRFKRFDAADNLNQHQWMIQNTLYLIEDMADEHALIKLASNERELEFLWKDLLQTIELIGQARAIGTGVAAAGSCGSVERIRMNYLVKKIKQNTEVILDYVPEREQTRYHIDKLLRFINEHILIKHCDVDPKYFFAMATDSSEFLYTQYDHAISQLKVET